MTFRKVRQGTGRRRAVQRKVQFFGWRREETGLTLPHKVRQGDSYLIIVLVAIQLFKGDKYTLTEAVGPLRFPALPTPLATATGRAIPS